MRWEKISFICSAAGAVAAPQGVTQNIPAMGATPEGCQPSYPGQFEILVHRITKRGSCSNTLALTLQNGILKDSQGRTGYIASNYQFQFDGPPQSGALVTSGFAVCPGDVLSLGASTTFYQCRSGSFYNLYDRHCAPQCEPVEIKVSPTGGSNTCSEDADTPIDQPPDGQGGDCPEHPSVPDPVTQIPDGQVQAPCAPTKTQDCQAQTPTESGAGSVTQIPDGQVQVPTHTPTPHQPCCGLLESHEKLETREKLQPREKLEAREMLEARRKNDHPEAVEDLRTLNNKISMRGELQTREKLEAREKFNDKLAARTEKREFHDMEKRQANQTGAGAASKGRQVQARGEAGAPVSQIEDGQIQVPTGCVPTSTSVPSPPPPPPVITTPCHIPDPPHITSACPTASPPPITPVCPPEVSTEPCPSSALPLPSSTNLPSPPACPAEVSTSLWPSPAPSPPSGNPLPPPPASSSSQPPSFSPPEPITPEPQKSTTSFVASQQPQGPQVSSPPQQPPAPSPVPTANGEKIIPGITTALMLGLAFTFLCL